MIQLNLHRVIPHLDKDYRIPDVTDPALTAFYSKIKSSKYAHLIVPLHQDIEYNGDDQSKLGRHFGSSADRKVQ